MTLFMNDAESSNVLGQHLAESCANVDFTICWNNSGEETTLNMVKRKMETAEGAFYMMDLGLVAEHYHRWVRLLPRVKPFFAIKSNPDDMVIGMLMALGAGFDCASQGEVEVIRGHMDRYLAPQRQQSEEQANSLLSEYMAQNVIYANPVKLRPHMRSAREHGVQWTTFDSIVELHKVAREWPDAKLVLRVIPPRVFKAAVQFEGKFGACSGEIPNLLATAKQLSLDIVGVSFHVGSGCDDVNAWSETIIYASKVFSMMRQFGYAPYLLDLGGGFHGVTAFPTENTQEAIDAFEKSCGLVNATLDQYFPEDGGYTLIAEPGRYFVEATFTLATKVIGKHSIRSTPVALEEAFEKFGLTTQNELNEFINRELQNAGHGDMVDYQDTPWVRYYVDDSVYGSFSCNYFDLPAQFLCFFHVDNATGDLNKLDVDAPTYPSKIYGATCDSADCIRKCSALPALEEGDWIVWRDAGAYWKASGCPFNGIPLPPVYYYVCSDQLTLLPEAVASMSLYHGQEVVLSSEGSGNDSGNEELFTSQEELAFGEMTHGGGLTYHEMAISNRMEAEESMTEEGGVTYYRDMLRLRRVSCSVEEAAEEMEAPTPTRMEQKA